MLFRNVHSLDLPPPLKAPQTENSAMVKTVMVVQHNTIHLGNK